MLNTEIKEVLMKIVNMELTLVEAEDLENILCYRVKEDELDASERVTIGRLRKELSDVFQQLRNM